MQQICLLHYYIIYIQHHVTGITNYVLWIPHHVAGNLLNIFVSYNIYGMFDTYRGYFDKC